MGMSAWFSSRSNPPIFHLFIYIHSLIPLPSFRVDLTILFPYFSIYYSIPHLYFQLIWHSFFSNLFTNPFIFVFFQLWTKQNHIKVPATRFSIKENGKHRKKPKDWLDTLPKVSWCAQRDGTYRSQTGRCLEGEGRRLGGGEKQGTQRRVLVQGLRHTRRRGPEGACEGRVTDGGTRNTHCSDKAEGKVTGGEENGYQRRWDLRVS